MITPGGRVGDSSPLGTHGPRRLDDYVRAVAHALMRKRGFTRSHAIATAKNALKRWRRGGGKVRPQVRAGAAAHLAAQEALDKRRGGGMNLANDEREALREILDFAWTEALHPRRQGKFASKGRGAKTTPRRKNAPRPKLKPHEQRILVAKRAQQEMARRIVRAHTTMRGEQGRKLSPLPKPRYELPETPSRFGILSAMANEARNRGLDVDLSWTEGLHPRDWRGRFVGKGEARNLAKPGEKGFANRAELHKNARLESRYRSHVGKIEKALSDNQHLASHNRFATPIKGPDGSVHSYDWSANPERAKLQARIVDSVYRRQAKTAKSEKKAVFLGGLPGAGKSTTLGKHFKESDFVTVNPDIFKEELARRGLTPNIAGLSPLEASALVHEESAHMALMLAARARKNNKNIIFDMTMGKASSVHERLDPLEQAGYSSRALFVDIPHAMSAQRVIQRHRRGYHDRLSDTTGTHLGQRLVPSSHISGGISPRGSSSANRDAFEEVKHRFGAYQLIDNSTGTPRLVESKGSF